MFKVYEKGHHYDDDGYCVQNDYYDIDIYDRDRLKSFFKNVKPSLMESEWTAFMDRAKLGDYLQTRYNSDWFVEKIGDNWCGE